MLRWLIGIILGKICESSNWQHILKIEDNYFRCKLATFQIGKDGQMFIFYFVYRKHQVILICNENKEIYVAKYDDTEEVYFLLGINIMGSLFLMGLLKDSHS